MEQHAVPQQISSYQFRLVGDMTLKQFFYVAGGLLIALLFYASTLPPIVKWPIMIFSASLGAALAFLPFEERPLSKWIAAFFRSVYSPTIFYWKREQLPAFYQEEATTPSEKVIAKGGEAGLKEYLAGITPQKSPSLSKLEETENTFLSELGILFKPREEMSKTSIPQSLPSIAVQITPGKGEEMTGILPQATPKSDQPPIQRQIPLSSFATYIRPSVTVLPKTEIKIVAEETPVRNPQESLQGGKVGKVSLYPVSPVINPQGEISGELAEFSIEAAPPNPPTMANTVVGQVFDSNGKIVEGAILEIRDIAGRPVRALRSNKLGHFIIVTPLIDGRYEIIIEKEGYLFSPITFEATGNIIPPIAIRGKVEPKIVVAEENTNNQNPMLNSN
jgi:hypothetical protein